MGLGMPSISQHDQEVAKKFGLNFNEVFDSEGVLINSEQVCFIIWWYIVDTFLLYMTCLTTWINFHNTFYDHQGGLISTLEFSQISFQP